MSPELKTLLIIALFAVITVLLFSPYNNGSGNEHYNNNFDEDHPAVRKYEDPPIPPYDTDDKTKDDKDLFRIRDHYEKEYEIDIIKSNEDLEEAQPIKHVRFMLDEEESKPDMVPPATRDVDVKSSYHDTHIDGDRVYDTNNIHGYCMFSERIPDDTQPYSDTLHEVLGMEMSMSDDEYNRMIEGRKSMKTYVEIDPDTSKFDPKVKKGNATITNLKELSAVVEGYRDNTLKTINCGNKKNSGYPYQFKMYDTVH